MREGGPVEELCDPVRSGIVKSGLPDVPFTLPQETQETDEGGDGEDARPHQQARKLSLTGPTWSSRSRNKPLTAYPSFTAWNLLDHNNSKCNMKEVIWRSAPREAKLWVTTSTRSAFGTEWNFEGENPPGR
ncbi:hypothetical protein PAMA_004437 [Pampus argenteus]